MKIYKRKSRKNVEDILASHGYILLRDKGVYINNIAGKGMGITKDKRIAYAKHNRKLHLGVVSVNTPDTFKPSTIGTTARLAMPEEVRKDFPAGKYCVVDVIKQDKTTWYKLDKTK